jgi:Transposase DDE domain
VGARSCCLRQLGETRKGEIRFNRFLHNKRVTAEEIAETAATHTARAAQGRHVLAIHDTTTLNFTKHAKSKKDFGKIGNGRDIGLYAHPTIVVEAAAAGAIGVDHAGGILGLAGISVYRREPAKTSAKTKAPLRDRKRKINDRESGRWLEGLAAASSVLAEADTVTLVGDRESDIYELFAESRPNNVHLLVRAQHNRALSEGGRLFEEMAKRPHIEGPGIEIPAKRGRSARSAKVRIAFARLDIQRPGRVYGAKGLPKSIPVFAVHIEEIDPPRGEKPVMWLLLTTHNVESLADALQIVEWYRARWTVEQLFRTLKTQGFDIEESQIESFAEMRKLVVAALIASLRVLQLVHARNGDTGQKLTDAMEPADEPVVEALVEKLEGKTERLKCPHPKGSLGRLAWVAGRLGGWSGYVGKHHRPAGPKTIARGLIKFDAIREGWRLRNDV